MGWMLWSVSDPWEAPVDMIVAFIKFTTPCTIKCLAGRQELSAIRLPVRGKDMWIKESENDRKENKS